uniref:Uncharacterized protein n=1 Tax=Rhizophagus irregularis (strain DAOM 181602 / DAOM 197198 / MUCL 43194) TaxID=747089 RepID=U9TTE4_RHIID
MFIFYNLQICERVKKLATVFINVDFLQKWLNGIHEIICKRGQIKFENWIKFYSSAF